jgi:hypothetical protein
MRKQMSDKGDGLEDAVNPLNVKRPGWPRRLYKTANWLLTIILLTVVPVVLGYVNTNLIARLLNPPPATAMSPWVWWVCVWFFGCEMLAALVIAIIGAVVLLQTTHRA